MTECFEESIIKYMKERLSSSPHDIDHVYRVLNLSLKICDNINNSHNIDMLVLKSAIFLHDIARVNEDNDQTGRINHAIVGSMQSRNFLHTTSFPKDKIEHVVECIQTHRYRTNNPPKTIEAKILFDADKIDSLGAIGIARSFGWIGENQAKIYFKPHSLAEYLTDNMESSNKGIIKNKKKHSVQIEFETKLKNIPTILYMEYSKKIALERLKYFEEFLKRLETEIEGQL